MLGCYKSKANINTEYKKAIFKTLINRNQTKIMKNSFLKVLGATALFCLTAPIFAQSSFFTRDLVSTILAQQGCSGIRMYPAISNNTQVVIIIGIDGNGNEITSKYQMFTGVRENSATYSSIGKSQAKQACDAYFSQNESFTSEIGKSELEAMLSGNSLGITIKPSGRNNFMVDAYTQGSEGLVAMGSAKSGAPCPSACGSPSQYLIFPSATH